METHSCSWDGQGLPGEVGGRGVDLLWLKIVVVEDGDGEVPLDLRECSLSVPGIPRSQEILGVVTGGQHSQPRPMGLLSGHPVCAMPRCLGPQVRVLGNGVCWAPG